MGYVVFQTNCMPRAYLLTLFVWGSMVTSLYTDWVLAVKQVVGYI